MSCSSGLSICQHSSLYLFHPKCPLTWKLKVRNTQKPPRASQLSFQLCCHRRNITTVVSGKLNRISKTHSCATLRTVFRGEKEKKEKSSIVRETVRSSLATTVSDIKLNSSEEINFMHVSRTCLSHGRLRNDTFLIFHKY